MLYSDDFLSFKEQNTCFKSPFDKRLDKKERRFSVR